MDEEAGSGGPGAETGSRAVREATSADLPAITRIYLAAYAQAPWNERNDPTESERYLRWVMSVPGTRCLVAVEAPPALGVPALAEERVCGFALAGPRAYADFVQDWERLAVQPEAGWPALPETLGYIWEIAVDPAAQRRGHGAALMAAALRRFRQEGLSTAILRSSDRATAAIGLYRRFGFQRLPLHERRDPSAGPWVLPLR